MGLALKPTFSSPVATAEFSKFSGPSVNGCKKKKKEREINASLSKAGPSWRCFARLKALFTLLPHCLSPSLVCLLTLVSPYFSLVLQKNLAPIPP